MDGNYLHGVVIDGIVYTRDNIFSCEELRTILRTECIITSSSSCEDFVWDYIFKEFVPSYSLRIPFLGEAKIWIKKNLRTRQQLYNWIDKNYEGIMKGTREQHYAWHLIKHTKSNIPLINKILYTSSRLEEADNRQYVLLDEWKKLYRAYNEWEKTHNSKEIGDNNWHLCYYKKQPAEKKWEELNLAESECCKYWHEWLKLLEEWEELPFITRKNIFMSLLK